MEVDQPQGCFRTGPADFGNPVVEASGWFAEGSGQYVRHPGIRRHCVIADVRCISCLGADGDFDAYRVAVEADDVNGVRAETGGELNPVR